MLKVAYLNIYGLAQDKLINLQNTFESNDAVILAETWHASKEATERHPSFIGKTPIQKTRRLTRQSGGIALFADPIKQRRIKLLRSSEYSLTFRCGTTIISGVYLPPSMPDNQFQRFLEAVSDSDIIVGDINVQFGREFGTSHSGPAGRRAIVERLCLAHNFEHLQPLSGVAKLDHMLSKRKASFQVVPPPVHSDHPMLLCYVEPGPQGLGAISNSEHCRRFHLRLLADEHTATELCRVYGERSTDYGHLVHQFIADLPTLGVVSRQNRIDELDQRLTDIVRSVAEQVLGSYSVSAQRKQPDRALLRMAEAGTHLAAVQSFKRMCRATAPVLAPEDPAKDLETEIREHFQRTFDSPNIPAPTLHYPPEHGRLFNPKLKVSSDTLWSYGVGDRDWTIEFSAQKIRRFIKRYDKTKACGSDSIHTRLLAGLDGSLFDWHLAHLFDACVLTGITPVRWNTSTVYPLKKKEDARHISDCRPIALTAMFRRIFESLVLKALHERADCAGLRQLHPTQAGFRQGHSTLLQAALSNDLSTLRPRPIRVFIDFKQAYDKVPAERLVEKLKDRKSPAVLTSLIIGLFTRGQVVVAANGRLTEPIPVFSGLFQGSLLSPQLFLLFIDDLATELGAEATPAIPNDLLFADDLQLRADNRAHAQRMCDVTTKWSDHNGMLVNHSKSGTLSRHLDLTVQGQPIPYTHVYRYLGLPHKSNGIDLALHMANNANKASKILAFVQRVGGEWPEWVKLVIYKTFIRPRLEYGGQLTIQQPTTVHYIEEVQTRALKWILPYAAHHQAVEAVTGVIPLSIRLAALAANFGRHCENMAQDHPARRFLTEIVGQPPWSESLLLPRACNSALFREFQHAARVRNTTIKRVSVRWQLDQLERSTVYARYITRQCRRDNYGPDKILFWSKAESRQLALSWRVGALAWNRQCPDGHRFNRRCAGNCVPLRNMPRRNERRPADPPPLYNTIDHLLNLEEWDDAAQEIREMLDYLT